MKNNLVITSFLIVLSCIGEGLFAQKVVKKELPELELAVYSHISVSDEVDSVVLLGRNMRVVWKDEPIMEREDCHMIDELIGTCAILDLPIIGTIEQLDSDLVMLFGGNRSGALQDRQLILLDANSGATLGWYGYITWRGNDVCEMFIDTESRMLLIGTAENQILENCLYVVDREKMKMEPLYGDSSSLSALEISMLGSYRPTVKRKGYFRLEY